MNKKIETFNASSPDYIGMILLTSVSLLSSVLTVILSSILVSSELDGKSGSVKTICKFALASSVCSMASYVFATIYFTVLAKYIQNNVKQTICPYTKVGQKDISKSVISYFWEILCITFMAACTFLSWTTLGMMLCLPKVSGTSFWGSSTFEQLYSWTIIFTLSGMVAHVFSLVIGHAWGVLSRKC